MTLPLVRSLHRREFLGNSYTALGGIGLSHLLARDACVDRGATHFPAKAQHVLQIFCPGAASHIDLWSHKPELERRDGQALPGEEVFRSFHGANGPLMRSPWPFRRVGQCGRAISTLLPHMARHIDDIAFVDSMTSRTNTHDPGCVIMNTGHVTEGFLAAGAWDGHALGAASDSLPMNVVIPDIRGEPPNGQANWSNGFLPARYQGVVMAAHQPVRNLNPPEHATSAQLDATRILLDAINRRDAELDPGSSELQARIAAYEFAGRIVTPFGVSYLNQAGRWNKTTKRCPRRWMFGRTGTMTRRTSRCRAIARDHHRSESRKFRRRPKLERLHLTEPRSFAHTARVNAHAISCFFALGVHCQVSVQLDS